MKRGLLNALTGLFNQLVIMAAGIIIPKLLITYYGSEVNGITISIAQIFACFTLLEAGVGAAALQALYAPVAQGDRAKASSILAAAGHYYRKTGLYYLAALLLFAFVYPLVTVSRLPGEAVAALILLQGAAGLLSYLFYAKYKLLLEAEGRSYVLLNLNAFVSAASNGFKIFFLLRGASILLVQSGFLLFSLIQFGILYLYMRKKHPWIDARALPDFSAVLQKRSALVHQISALVFNNIDLVLLNIFCGFMVSGVYLLYTLFFEMIHAVVYTLASSANFALGQLYNTDLKRYIAMHDCFECFFYVPVFALYGTAYLFILPFMRLYTMGVRDINYIDPVLPPLLLAVALLSAGRIPANNTINYAGHFRQTRSRAIAESVIHLAVSLLLLPFFGVYGIVAGTIAALLYRSSDIVVYANRRLLGRSPLVTYRRWALHGALLGVMLLGASFLHPAPDSYGRIILFGGISFAAMTLVLFVGTALAERTAYSYLRTAVTAFVRGFFRNERSWH